MPEAQTFGSRADWREWLLRNHEHVRNAWLTIHKKHWTGPGIKLDEAVEEAICFGWIDGGMRRVDNDRFVLYFSRRRKDSPWSAINKERAERLIEAGFMTASGLRAVETARQDGRWDSAYTSRKPPGVPDDLARALREERGGWEAFTSLSPSRQVRYIAWIGQAEKTETRARRVRDTVFELKKGEESRDGREKSPEK
ncbi:MAG: YdeI/OmpD-associated family protein [Candidatus Lokiarchaeota archaeon]|nr:YdeI/OmpD-associated family protein [Candidatus Lokiarchaeota archaeon]